MTILAIIVAGILLISIFHKLVEILGVLKELKENVTDFLQKDAVEIVNKASEASDGIENIVSQLKLIRKRFGAKTELEEELEDDRFPIPGGRSGKLK